MPRSLRSYIIYSFGFFVVLELMLAAAIYWWPTFVENIDSVLKIANTIKMLGRLAETVNEEGIPAYVAGQHFFKGCSALGTAACSLFAANAIAGEAQRGTLEIMLARPVSRTRLFTERWIGGFMAVAVPVFVSSLTIPALLEMVDENMHWNDILRTSAYMCVFLAPIYGITFAWSARSNEPLLISYVMLFLAILAFALYLVESATDYTPYRLVDPRAFLEIIKHDRLNWLYTAPLLAVTAVSYGVGLFWFKRRTP